MPLIYHPDDYQRLSDWCGPRCHAPDGYGRPVDHFTAIGVVDDDDVIQVGMIFCRYSGDAVEIHLAIDEPRYATLGFYKFTFNYAFTTLNVSKVWALCVDGYERNEKLMRGMFFKKEGVLRKHIRVHGKLTDMAFYGCLRTDCRLIPKKYRKLEKDW